MADIVAHSPVSLALESEEVANVKPVVTEEVTIETVVLDDAPTVLEDNASTAATKSEGKKSLKRRSIFRKSKKITHTAAAADEKGEYNILNKKEEEEEGDDLKEVCDDKDSEQPLPAQDDETPPALKISRKRFGFGIKKAKKSIYNEAPDVEINKESNNGAPECSEEAPLLKEHVYTGPESETENKGDEETMVEQEDVEMKEKLDDGEHDTSDITVEENEKKTSSKIPVKKVRKLYWKRMSRSIRTEETPENSADCKESHEAVENEVDAAASPKENEVNDDEEKKVIIEEVNKKNAKKPKRLSWMRLPKSDKESCTETPENIIGDAELSNEALENETGVAIQEEGKSNGEETEVEETEEKEEVVEKHTKKSKRLSWMRLPKASKEPETPENNADCEPSHDTLDVSASEEDKSNPVAEVSAEEIARCKKPTGKGIRLLRWKRLPRDIDMVDTPSETTAEEACTQTTEAITEDSTEKNEETEEATVEAKDSEAKEVHEKEENKEDVLKKQTKKSKRLNLKRFSMKKVEATNKPSNVEEMVELVNHEEIKESDESASTEEEACTQTSEATAEDSSKQNQETTETTETTKDEENRDPENIEKVNKDTQENKEVVKKRTKKSKRLSWKRFSLSSKSIGTQSVLPLEETATEKAEREDLLTQGEDVEKEEDSEEKIKEIDDKVAGNTLVPTKFNQVAILELTPVVEVNETDIQTTPIDSDSTVDCEDDVAETTLEQSVLTYVTQLNENCEEDVESVPEVEVSTNPFLNGHESEAEEAIDETTPADKTWEFVLVDQYTHKPKEESFYLTKKALKVYKRAHLAQHYCQPCCTMQ